VIDSVTKWMPGWKRRGWRKSDGGPVLNRDLLEGIDEALRGRNVEFSWVKGHAGHPLNEAADERANAAAKAYQQKQEPRRGPGFTRATDAGAAVAASAPVAAAAAEAPASSSTAAPSRTSTPVAEAEFAAPLWAETSDLLDGLDLAQDDPIVLQLPLSPDEHARLRDRADAQGITLEEALRRLI
jgi:ribonuclease HI